MFQQKSVDKVHAVKSKRPPSQAERRQQIARQEQRIGRLRGDVVEQQIVPGRVSVEIGNQSAANAILLIKRGLSQVSVLVAALVLAKTKPDFPGTFEETWYFTVPPAYQPVNDCSVVVARQPMIGAIAGFALGVNVLVAGVIGGTIPFLIKRLGKDPAMMTGPILTTITDITGVSIYLGLSTLFLLT
ncbi:MAG: magnesium transporter [Spirochaetaceae bacterium]|nr:MAG: magnesium transporter [Spirochaetaceae bacterium]